MERKMEARVQMFRRDAMTAPEGTEEVFFLVLGNDPGVAAVLEHAGSVPRALEEAAVFGGRSYEPAERWRVAVVEVRPRRRVAYLGAWTWSKEATERTEEKFRSVLLDDGWQPVGDSLCRSWREVLDLFRAWR